MGATTTSEAVRRRGPVPAGSPPAVVDLADSLALDPARTGAKAAALARARAAGLPVLPGFVVTTGFQGAPETDPDLRAAWATLSDGGARPLVVRSSSTVEDGSASSMAGVFASVVGVQGWDGFLAALRHVLRSRRRAVAPAGAGMAVLVQPFLPARASGVLFGADPVTGRTDRLVVAAVAGTPEALVSGAVEGSLYVLDRRGRRRSRPERPLPEVGRPQLRALAGLAASVAREFGRPQDVEWAIDGAGRLHLLQSRPITAGLGDRRARGPVFGPGPVAETFPDPLSPLEQDLWLEPLREGIRHALLLTGLVSRRQAAASPVIVAVGGRAAADLSLLGTAPARHPTLARLDPRRPARRLAASWRIGRLRAALPALALDLIDEVDRQLLEVPPLAELSERALADLLHQSRQALVALHGMEILTGQLLSPGGTPAAGVSAAATALRVLGQERARGSSDPEILTHHPVVLALLPPRVGTAAVLPSAAPVPDGPAPRGRVPAEADPSGLRREALRLRARWVQELTARAAAAVGQRLARRGVLREVEAVRALRLPQLDALVSGAPVSGALAAGRPPAAGEGREAEVIPLTPPLPATFRLGPTGTVIPLAHRASRRAAGRGAGGGVGRGPVHQGDGPPPPGSVLVVRTLDPGLAPALPHLAGLVAETGSVLSHLAILAREHGVATVVAYPGALARFPAGTTVEVDGDRGRVRAGPGPAAKSRGGTRWRPPAAAALPPASRREGA